MKLKYKILGLVMFVMLICCVSAASATDVDNITVTEDTDIIELDDTVDSVEEVEQDRSAGTGTCDCDDCDCEIVEPTLPTGSNPITLTPSNYANKFTNGVFNDPNADEVIFDGTFTSNSYKTLKFNQGIIITATGSTFNNIGFELAHDGIVLNGANIIIDAPDDKDCYAIDIEDADNVIVINNKIDYTCDYENEDFYNYAIRAVESENLTIYGNEINASVPLKQPNWAVYCTIYSDYVAGVAIESCDNLIYAKNNLTVIGNDRVGDYPTLDAFIIANSDNAKIWKNNIYEIDPVTETYDYSYIYGIDVYLCNNLKICSNTVDMNGEQSGGHLVGGNGTGAAYCIQLTGPHTGIKICNNTLNTKNNGPNLGIYSQNFAGASQLTICGNHINVTGKADTDPWSLVSGMELQDSNATVYHNDIVVYNTNTYDPNNYAFGISYCQSTGGGHYYNITDNNVTVHNADYTISILSGSWGYIGQNNLTAIANNTPKYGNNTVDAPIGMIGPNYP